MESRNFAALILTNGRPDRVYTYNTLRRCGYSGKIYLVVDDLDQTLDQYKEIYGDQVVVFDKKAIASTFDQADNFNDFRAIVYARNASFEIADSLGLSHFVQLDDDYQKFDWRFDRELNYAAHVTRKLDGIFLALVSFLDDSGADSIAMLQGGDFISGELNQNAETVTLIRKCMNSFFCSTKKKFKFLGRVNEDVNTYTSSASKGLVLFSTNHVSLTQKQTQTNSGGMTEMYLDSGTYVKSFYSIIFQPSSVKVKVLQSKFKRLHHSIDWNTTVPKILNEKHKRAANG